MKEGGRERGSERVKVDLPPSKRRQSLRIQLLVSNESCYESVGSHRREVGARGKTKMAAPADQRSRAEGLQGEWAELGAGGRGLWWGGGMVCKGSRWKVQEHLPSEEQGDINVRLRGNNV